MVKGNSHLIEMKNHEKKNGRYPLEENAGSYNNGSLQNQSRNFDVALDGPLGQATNHLKESTDEIFWFNIAVASNSLCWFVLAYTTTFTNSSLDISRSSLRSI